MKIDWGCWRPTVFQGSTEEFLEAEVKGSWTSFKFWPVKNLRVAHFDLKHFRPPARMTESTCAALVASERTDPSTGGQVSAQRDVEMEWDGFGFDMKPFTVSIQHDSETLIRVTYTALHRNDYFLCFNLRLNSAELTQLSKELHSKSGVDEKEQHEEQTEVSHLVKHKNVEGLEEHFNCHLLNRWHFNTLGYTEHCVAAGGWDNERLIEERMMNWEEESRPCLGLMLHLLAVM